MPGSPARGYYPDETYNVGAIKELFVKFLIGTDAAHFTLKTLGEIVSVTHTGTGAYTIQFSQSYYQSLGLSVTDCTQNSYSASGACEIEHVHDANEAANGTLKVLITNAAGTAVDPVTGDVIHIGYKVQVDSILA